MIPTEVPMQRAMQKQGISTTNCTVLFFYAKRKLFPNNMTFTSSYYVVKKYNNRTMFRVIFVVAKVIYI